MWKSYLNIFGTTLHVAMYHTRVTRYSTHCPAAHTEKETPFPSIIYDAFFRIIITTASVLAETSLGMTDASPTRCLFKPRTL